MKDTVFISGSIKIKKLPTEFIESINTIIKKEMKILIGDALGVDSIVQKYLREKNYFDVIVYYVNAIPRNNEGNFTSKKVNFRTSEEYLKLTEVEKEKIEKSVRKIQSFKDLEMERDATHLLVLWDGISSGSKNNIINGLRDSKYVKVYYEKFLNQEETTINNIQRIYETNNGINLSEIKSKVTKIIGEKYSLPDSYIKKYDIDKLYPITTKKIEENFDLLKKFIIKKTYKGKIQYSYKPDIIDFLVDDYLRKHKEIRKDYSLSLFDN